MGHYHRKNENFIELNFLLLLFHDIMLWIKLKVPIKMQKLIPLYGSTSGALIRLYKY